MARLIDADAIDYPEYFYTRERHPDEFIEGFHQGKIDAINDVKALAPTVDAVEVSRLGKLGQLMMPYPGCPRGMIGQRGEVGGGKYQSLEILELNPITDIDGNNWVPVLDSDLAALKDKAKGAVEVVRCKDCKWRNTYCCPYMNFNAAVRDDSDYCSDGERKDND